MSNFKEIIADLEEKGITTAKKARGYLAFQYDIDGKEATEILVEAGISGVRSGGSTFDEILKWLGEHPRTEYDLYETIITHGTPNEARWIANRNAIRAVIIKVYENASGEEFLEVAATAEQKEAIAEKVPAKKAK